MSAKYKCEECREVIWLSSEESVFSLKQAYRLVLHQTIQNLLLEQLFCKEGANYHCLFIWPRLANYLGYLLISQRIKSFLLRCHRASPLVLLLSPWFVLTLKSFLTNNISLLLLFLSDCKLLSIGLKVMKIITNVYDVWNTLLYLVSQILRICQNVYRFLQFLLRVFNSINEISITSKEGNRGDTIASINFVVVSIVNQVDRNSHIYLSLYLVSHHLLARAGNWLLLEISEV